MSNEQYLQRTPTIASNRKTFTFSAWIKLTEADMTIMDNDNYHPIISAINPSNGFSDMFGYHNAVGSRNGFRFYGGEGNYGTKIEDVSDALTDGSTASRRWFHVVWAMDSTQTVADDRIRFYLNGEEKIKSVVRRDVPLNYEYGFNNNVKQTIGRHGWLAGAASAWQGSMSQVTFVDGRQLSANLFGTNGNTEWVSERRKLVLKNIYSCCCFCCCCCCCC